MKYKVKETTKVNGNKTYTVYSKNDWKDFKTFNMLTKILSVLCSPLLYWCVLFYGKEETFETLHEAINYINTQIEEELQELQTRNGRKVLSEKIVYTQD